MKPFIVGDVYTWLENDVHNAPFIVHDAYPINGKIKCTFFESGDSCDYSCNNIRMRDLFYHHPGLNTTLYKVLNEIKS